MEVTDLNLGKAAEHLVVANLIMQGYHAFLADQGLPYDVVVDAGGRLLKVQVKATRGPRPVPQRLTKTQGYQFWVKRCGKRGAKAYVSADFDIMAFVAMDIGAIAYMPFLQTARGAIILRPPGTTPAGNATRRENIDQFPFSKALMAL